MKTTILIKGVEKSDGCFRTSYLESRSRIGSMLMGHKDTHIDVDNAVMTVSRDAAMEVLGEIELKLNDFMGMSNMNDDVAGECRQLCKMRNILEEALLCNYDIEI